jgi:fatty-acyl-CoA synthase
MRYRDQIDIAAFAATPLDERLDGRDLIASLAGRDPAGPALHYLPDGRGGAVAITLGDLVAAAGGIAARLAGAGIGRADTVAMLLPNGPGTAAAALGTLAQAVLAPINFYLEASQVLALVAESRARAILLPTDPPPAVAAMIAQVRGRLESDVTVIEIDCGVLPAVRGRLAPRSLDDQVALFHTGGTTGLPKFVPLTARHLAAGSLISQFGYGFAPGDRVVCAMPMFHVGGLFACFLFPLAAGAEVVMLGPAGYRGEGVVADLWSTLRTSGVTVLVGPPTVYGQLRPDGAAPTLRLLVNGAAGIPPAIEARVTAATGLPLVQPWGQTECTLAVTCAPRDGLRKPGSVGLALPYCAVKAVRVDDQGRVIGDCAVDEIGVLAVSGPMVFAGYPGRPAAAQPFFPGGWLDTGDLGRVDADGYVWVTGRAKELIKRGGHGIDPGTIEDALMAHDAVALAAAIGKPDAYAGELPIAYVELKPGRVIEGSELAAFAAGRIAERAAIPKEVVVLPRLPVTPVGKVHKQPLKLDASRRAALACLRGVVGDTAPLDIDVAQHRLHGIAVTARVRAGHVDAARAALAELPFWSSVQPFEGNA